MAEQGAKQSGRGANGEVVQTGKLLIGVRRARHMHGRHVGLGAPRGRRAPTSGPGGERKRLPDGAGSGEGQTSPLSLRLAQLDRARFEIIWTQIPI
jgi:hypothetical protein